MSRMTAARQPFGVFSTAKRCRVTALTSTFRGCLSRSIFSPRASARRRYDPSPVLDAEGVDAQQELLGVLVVD
jgi:hypothetical protein